MPFTPHSTDHSPWLDLFPESSRRCMHAGSSLFMVGDAVSDVYVVENGVMAELRHDDGHTHASCLCHAGMLAGVRWVGTAAPVHAVEAMALGDVLLRSVPYELFVRATREDGRYASAALSDMSKRVDSARRLSDCLAQTSTRDHVMSVLHAIADEYNTDAHASTLVAVPTRILQRLTGCPVSALVSAIKDLVSAGRLKADAHGVKLPAGEL